MVRVCLACVSCVCGWVRVCVIVCEWMSERVCVRERGRKQRWKEGGREGERERGQVCAYA